MWEEICGKCGTKQSLLSQKRRDEMAAAQSKAEQLLSNFDFDQAVGIATGLGDEPHARLSFLKPWAEDFVARVERIREQQARRAAESLAAALEHEAAHDYSSAVSALDSVPQLLRRATVVGAGETVESALKRVREKQTECQRLRLLIKHRVEQKELVDLDHEIDNLLLLEPANLDAIKLKVRLADRERRIQEQRHAALHARQRDDEIKSARQCAASHAEKLLSECLYKEAAASLENLAPEVMTVELVALREQAIGRHDEACRLKHEIKTALATGDEQKVVAALDAYQSLMPIDQDAEQLRQTLVRSSRYCDRIRHQLIDGKWRRAFEELANIPAAFVPLSEKNRLGLRDAVADARQRSGDAVTASKQRLLETRQIVLSATRIAAIAGWVSCVVWSVLSLLVLQGRASNVGPFGLVSLIGFAAFFASCLWMLMFSVLHWYQGKLSPPVFWILALMASIPFAFNTSSLVGYGIGCVPVVAAAFCRMPSLLDSMFVDFGRRIQQCDAELTLVNLYSQLLSTVAAMPVPTSSGSPFERSDALELLVLMLDALYGDQKCPYTHVSPKIPEKKLQQAVASYATRVRPEEILALFGLGGRGKPDFGVSITADGLFWVSLGEKGHLRFADVREVRLRRYEQAEWLEVNGKFISAKHLAPAIIDIVALCKLGSRIRNS